MSESYIDICTSLDGKVYKESESYGFDFLSRHKERCRRKLRGGENIVLYETSSYDVKESALIYNVCRGCGFKIRSMTWHFRGDEAIGLDLKQR
jgi:hypothetical protein